MRWVLLWFVCGCAREPWLRASVATGLPALVLRAAYDQRERDLGARQHDGYALSASLRWQTRAAASAIPSQFEQSPASWLAPCELDDYTCLTEQIEAEAEIADALREGP